MLGLVPSFFFLSLCWLASAETNLTAEDNAIIWPSSAPLWTPTPTVCSSEGQAHFAYQANMSMSYEFTGTAIYLSILRSNVTGVYTVSVDNGTPVLIDGFHATTICDIQFGQTGLSFGPHTVTTELFGQSPQVQNGSPNVYLELDAFVYTTPGDSSTSVSPTTSSSATESSATDSPATINSTSTAIPALAVSSKSTLKASAVAGIVIAFVASLVAMAAFFIFLHRRNKRHSMMHRKTLVDRDSDLASRVSQFPPPESNNTHQTNIFPGGSLMPLANMTNTENQTLSHPELYRPESMAGRNGDVQEAPPVYEAPGGKSGR